MIKDIIMQLPENPTNQVANEIPQNDRGLFG
jgi:hypothetical protein